MIWSLSLAGSVVWSAAYRYPSEDIPESPPPIPELEAALNVIERLADALASLRPE